MKKSTTLNTGEENTDHVENTDLLPSNAVEQENILKYTAKLVDEIELDFEICTEVLHSVLTTQGKIYLAEQCVEYNF